MRERLLPVLVLAMLAGCSPSRGGEQAGADARADRTEAPLPPVAEAPVAAMAPVPRNPAPARKPVAAVEDLPADDNAVEAAEAFPPPALPEQPYRPMDLPPSNVAASAEAFPDEVTAFMVERDSCDHFRGEEPYDADRRAYIEESIAELCTGTDAKLATLRRRYADNPAVTQALGGYEERIERPRGTGAPSPLFAPFLSQ